MRSWRQVGTCGSCVPSEPPPGPALDPCNTKRHNSEICKRSQLRPYSNQAYRFLICLYIIATEYGLA